MQSPGRTRSRTGIPGGGLALESLQGRKSEILRDPAAAARAVAECSRPQAPPRARVAMQPQLAQAAFEDAAGHA
eukprot:CAMPEP_0179844392 /NCGR_PEP_ID=MMETSP0982-20121206/4313_1 /TAXON_ID=483367 /ORGANISM="non described non described, Strain CCMP 2436" /LENGTH=73 /DNA_ID=CAMNT_0021729083 /DNA_START=63 /DNA_END=285 /DNA_ORIENTATION=-